MGVITTGAFAKLLWPGINAVYGASYAEYPQECKEIFKTINSRKAFEEILQQTGYGMAQVKQEGAAIAYDNQRQGFINRYQHITYALGFIITREMMEDDLYDTRGIHNAQGLAFSMRQTKETVAANVLNRGFNSGYVGGDGVELYSSVHPNTSGGTWRNELATPADISEASIEQACIDISKYTTDRGLKIAIQVDKLIIPTDLQFEAERILTSYLQNDTANNAVNVLRGKFPGGIAINHYLTDVDAWFIRTNAPNGFTHFERRADDFATDNDFDTENAKFKASGRYSFGWSDPRCTFGSEGA